MSKQLEAARTALRSVDRLHESFHAPIMAALAEHGVIPNDGGVIHATATGRSRIARVQAEAKINEPVRAALVRANGQLRQCGVSFDDILSADGSEISLEKLNNVMAKAGKDVSFKMDTKSLLHKAGLID